jgi:hypothetical protein
MGLTAEDTMVHGASLGLFVGGLPFKYAAELRVVAEYGQEATDLAALRGELQQLIRARLTVAAEVELVPPDTLPRSEMKSRLTRRLYEGE